MDYQDFKDLCASRKIDSKTVIAFAWEMYRQGKQDATMKELQSHGVVSDNCLDALDVAEADIDRATKWLEREKGKLL